jgi:hypothetical protein
MSGMTKKKIQSSMKYQRLSENYSFAQLYPTAILAWHIPEGASIAYKGEEP